MNLLKNNNHLLKFNGTWRADSLIIEKTKFGAGINISGTGRIKLTNIPTWLFDSPESVLVADIPLNPLGSFTPTTNTINLTARTGTTVVVTVTYSYNGNQDLSGITTSLTATPDTIQYEKLIGFDQG